MSCSVAAAERAMPRRLLTALVALALLVALAPGARIVGAATGDPVLVNEVLVSTTGTDVEFAELYGIPGTSLAGLSLVVIESDAGAAYGTIDQRLDFGAGAIIGGNGFHLVGNALVTTTYGVTPNTAIPDGFLENSSLTVAVVTTASLAGGVGTFVTGGEVVRDAIGIMDIATDTPALGAPRFGPDGTFLPAGAHRVSDGVDTDTTADWALADFSLNSVTNPNTPTAGTPYGGAGEVVADCGDPVRVLEGAGGSATVTAADSDGMVSGFTITAVAPSDPGTFSMGTVTPSASVGAPGSAQVLIDAATPAGGYTVTVRAANGDATPQTDTCDLAVTVDPVLTVGAVEGETTDAEDGATDASPYTGQTVTVRGVVAQRLRLPTAAGGVNYAFFLQSTMAGADGNPLTSDGLYVFMNRFTTLLRQGSGSYAPTVGDQVVLRGPMTEFFNLTELNNPRVVAVERTGVPMSELATTEAAPPDDVAAANRYWERHEGMRFSVPAGALVTGPRDVFASTFDAEGWVIRGDHPLAERTDPFARRVFRDVHPLDDIGPGGSFDNGNGMRILLTSHGLKWLAASNTTLIAPMRTFDTVSNELTGGLTYTFNKFGIEVEQQPSLAHGADPAANAPPSAAVGGAEYATSDYNVENLYDFRDDPNDGCDFAGNPGCPGVSPPFDYVPLTQADYDQHLADLAAQIAGPMHAPDILMIQEAEDQDICAPSGTAMVCGTADDADGQPDTLQDLALAISAAGGPTYATAYDRDGADDRGIVAAFMYRIDSVQLLPIVAGDPVLGSTTGISYRGAPLASNADVSNPKAVNAVLPADVDRSTGTDGANVYTRAPQVGHFRVWRDGIGTSVFTDLWAVSNHFSSTPDARVGQRTEQAAYNAAIFAAIVAADPDARFVSAGDFNVFPRPDDPFAPDSARYPSDQLGPMYDAGLHNLYDTLLAEVPSSAYSYTFVGMAQTLDMQWANGVLFDELVQIRAAHLNADFPADFDGDVARGASDHDPQVARWSKEVTLERLRALVDYFVATGAVDATKAVKLYDRLDKAAGYLASGQLAAYRSQLIALGDQARDLAPKFVSPTAAAALEREADRLAGL